MRNSLLEHISRLDQIRFRIPARKKTFGSSVEFEGGDVTCRGAFNSSLFAWRKAGLQLLSNRHRDLALNGENIGNIAVISLAPERPIRRHIDQLGVDPHPITRSLDTTFHYTANSQLMADLVQIPRGSALVLHHGGAVDHFQIGQAG